MSEELSSLVAEQRRLILEETIIVDLLRKIKDEMHKIQIEQLQLDSMILAEERKEEDTVSSVTTSATAADMDSAEKVNLEELDLNVTNALTNMIEGQFYAEGIEEEEEEEEDDDDDDRGVPDKGEFILSL